MSSPTLRLTFLVALATALFAMMTAQAISPPGAPADHLLSYKAKTPKAATKFTPIDGIHLEDDFEDLSLTRRPPATSSCRSPWTVTSSSTRSPTCAGTRSRR
ncbi:MAG: hypothetical protein HY271_09685 [Deltaproteobacteria bacterium]|nr:hypothetical protein [Deltaproteobacteria bacterium]